MARRNLLVRMKNMRTTVNMTAKKQMFLKCAVLLTATLFLKTLLYVDTSVQQSEFSDITSLNVQEETNDVSNLTKCRVDILPKHVKVDVSAATLDDVLVQLTEKPSKGGWRPGDCKRESKVAIIVPFRNREHNLPVFLRHMHTFLQKQKRNYKIFIIEQSDDLLINRGSLINVGFKEAMKHDSYTCLIFHDVDMLPENQMITYNCVKAGAIHMSNMLSTHNYSSIYGQYVGGVMSIKPRVFERVNGYPNVYWGWGGEDDDFLKRIIHSGVKFYRQTDVEGRYLCLGHGQTEQIHNKKRFQLLKTSAKRFKRDGLFNLDYNITKVEIQPLFVKISVEFLKLRENIHRDFDI